MAQVMIVDDHPDVREYISLIYDKAGHSTVAAANGRDAINLLRTGMMPNLVLLDLMMPVMDGLSFLELVRSHPVWKNLHVVIYTGYDQGIQADRLRDLGVGEILLKDAVDTSRLVALASC